jgi:hypothetical protein
MDSRSRALTRMYPTNKKGCGEGRRVRGKRLGRPCGDVCVSASTPTHNTHTKGKRGEGGEGK